MNQFIINSIIKALAYKESGGIKYENALNITDIKWLTKDDVYSNNIDDVELDKIYDLIITCGNIHKLKVRRKYDIIIDISELIK